MPLKKPSVGSILMSPNFECACDRFQHAIAGIDRISDHVMQRSIVLLSVIIYVVLLGAKYDGSIISSILHLRHT